ncbi:MAG: MTH1187 family thiamine-binding protein [Bacteroidales bacterium]
MKNIVNVAIQVLPQTETKKAYDLVDDAIEVIKASGLKYKVCPFETVVEGPYDLIMETIEKMQQTCFENGAVELLVYLKIQNRHNSDVAIQEKMHKYE